jgi:hypothetical protein
MKMITTSSITYRYITQHHSCTPVRYRCITQQHSCTPKARCSKLSVSLIPFFFFFNFLIFYQRAFYSALFFSLILTLFCASPALYLLYKQTKIYEEKVENGWDFCLFVVLILTGNYLFQVFWLLLRRALKEYWSRGLAC